MSAAVVESSFASWFVGAAALLAAVLTLVGAMRGTREHRLPRVMLGVSCGAMAASFIFDAALGILYVTANARRGAALVFFPSLAWTAWSGMRVARRVEAAAEGLGLSDA